MAWIDGREVQPKGGVPGRIAFDVELERDDRLPRSVSHVLAYRKFHRELQAVLGVVHGQTILLPRIGQPPLGPAYDRDGHPLRWSLWAPHRALLIDVFARRLPRQAELEDRAAFAETHALKYAIVEPSQQLNMTQLAEWLDERPAGATTR